MTSLPWTLENMPDLTGRRALVTGVTSGLGEYVALELARKGAEVVLAARTEEKLHTVVEDVKRVVPSASLVSLLCDLADLSSVRRAAEQAASYGPLHILVNNAGVMATPHRRTVDGFDLQLGTNHLGHFALTGLLLGQLAASDEARVVTVSSVAHRLVRSVPLTDPRTDEGQYRKWRAYGHSKLANLLFAFELDRRARAAGLAITSVAAHPGLAATNLVSSGMNMRRTTADGTIGIAVTRLLGQSSREGALPLLMAATMPDLPGSTYLGPSGPGELRGAPGFVTASGPARDEEMAARFWETSEEATGVTYP